jgi:hypothetical protein
MEAISSRLERYGSISKHPGTQAEADVSDSRTGGHEGHIVVPGPEAALSAGRLGRPA